MLDWKIDQLPPASCNPSLAQFFHVKLKAKCQKSRGMKKERKRKNDLDEDIKAHIVDMQSRGSNFYPKMRIPVSLFTSSNFHFNFFQRAYCFSFRVEIKRKKKNETRKKQVIRIGAWPWTSHGLWLPSRGRMCRINRRSHRGG